MIRPRGWHLPERHVLVDGEPVSGSLFDFGLWLWHNGAELLERGSGRTSTCRSSSRTRRRGSGTTPSSWRRTGSASRAARCARPSSIETILAAFEMDEILHALGPHATALNAGRWDYIFSVIKKFRAHEHSLLPDRAQVTMTVPFMRAYTELLVRTCHRRGAHAIGGMAAFIPSRRDPEVNAVALAKVREDKERESGDGFDGTWVAHLDLVPVATEVFDGVLGERPNQLERPWTTSIEAAQLTDFRIPGRDHGRRPRHERLRRRPLPPRLAARHRRRRDRQPDGGRGHGRDLARAGVAVGEGRPLLAGAGADEIAPWRDEHPQAAELFERSRSRRSSRNSSRPGVRSPRSMSWRSRRPTSSRRRSSRRSSRARSPRDGAAAGDAVGAVRRLADAGARGPAAARRARPRLVRAERRARARSRARTSRRRSSSGPSSSRSRRSRGARITRADVDELIAAEERFAEMTERPHRRAHARPRGAARRRPSAGANHAFHDVIYRVAAAPMVERIAKSACRTFSGHAVWGPGGSDIDDLYHHNVLQHRAIREALAAGSAAGALAREHVLHSFRLLETVLSQAGAAAAAPIGLGRPSAARRRILGRWRSRSNSAAG